MKKIIWIIITIIALAAIIYFFTNDDDEQKNIIIKPEFGKFKSTVLVSGELRSKNSIDIKGPSNARRLNIWQLKINKLVDEGTQVKKGEFVAELDKSEIMSRLNEVQLNIEKAETQYKQKQLDSTLTLSNARNELENLKFSMEQKKLEWEQSIYEPPATQRQAEISYLQAKRSYEQAKINYKTKVEQAKAEIKVVNTDLSKELSKLKMIQELLAAFTITAPADGMVIYDRTYGGRKKTVGSQISAWDPVVATLPDLSQMQSLTYVNEIDIQKIKENQKVSISLDANPDKKLQGKVISVANIGQELKGNDAKVFEVIIDIIDKDTTLLPSMTTSNEILIAKKDSVLFIPIDAVYKDEENPDINYVFLKYKGNIVKKQIKMGMMNENEVIIKEGLKKEDEIIIGNNFEDIENFEFISLGND